MFLDFSSGGTGYHGIVEIKFEMKGAGDLFIDYSN